MTALARRNGWRGFDRLGEQVGKMWMYRCDGMPRPMGCGEETTVPRAYSKVGAKPSGWLVIYGHDEDGGDDGKGNDLDVVLVFCPSCAVVVREQETKRRA